MRVDVRRATRGATVALLLVSVCPPATRAWASTPADAASTQHIQGMTLSTPGIGEDWGSDAMVGTLDELAALGVNWIAIHPYAEIRRDGEVRGYYGRLPSPAPPRWIRRPIEEAHRRGMKVLVKPHLAYWGSGFAWRGEIEFTTAAAWDRFFATYGSWVTRLADLARDADAFAVGTELDRTVRHEAQWRALIAAVRRDFPGPLTYAANWSDYRQVPFWDALDAVGIQAYFPLLTAPDQGRTPSQGELDAGWARIMGELRDFRRRTGKWVVFTELGYSRSSRAPYEPWDYGVGGTDAELVQARCLEAALKAIAAEPAVVGSFLWKWFPGGRQPRNFAMSSPAMRRVIAGRWRSLAAPPG